MRSNAGSDVRRGSEAGQLLTAEQLAERWQIAKSHVYALTRDGAIPTVKLGRYYRYHPEAIEQFEIGGVGNAGVAQVRAS